VSVAAAADFSIREDAGGWILAAEGDWLMRSAGPLFRRLDEIEPRGKAVEIDLSGISELDTGGAWLLFRTARRLEEAGLDVTLVNVSDEHRFLIEKVGENARPCTIAVDERPVIVQVADRVGTWAVGLGEGIRNALGFTGLVAVTTVRVIVQPRRFRLNAFVNFIERTGLDALPIVGMISFLIGIVIAYMGAELLRPYGGQVFFTDLLGITMLRELAVLLVAIIVAGRTGSAFTAQIGSMKLHEEIDAMRTLGLDPIEILVVPRVLALIVTLPLLAFFGDIMGLMGGGLMAWVVLDTPPDVFLTRLREAIDLSTFFVGISRAPFFAAIIALCGCYEGLQVEGSADSVGYRTTKSVVEAIFLVIITTALFSVFYLTIDI
jgi:phospholipid/cholesterol/gamma-HCH transport system permease protein